MHVIDDETMHEILGFVKEHKAFVRNRQIMLEQANALREQATEANKIRQKIEKTLAAYRSRCCCTHHHQTAGAKKET